ncbi:hypothetical protein DY000_02046584 [Brassica cretica]|uniref:Retrotransposon gag domain-containing protein n=1 Tax=Brassica cretica TaxID=69181 RepID=A0ABQ7EUD7_BRACR|nr:hypothetical protein DY000_02046584 [Brassica cretica]
MLTDAHVLHKACGNSIPFTVHGIVNCPGSLFFFKVFLILIFSLASQNILLMSSSFSLVSLKNIHNMWPTTCGETEKIEVLILKVDENGMLRDEEGRTRNSAGQLINAQGAVIPDVIDVAEMNYFDLSREWYDWVGQDPFQGLPHQDPRNHIEELEDLVSRSEQNVVSEYHMLCKIFPYSISGDTFRWFSQLQPGSLTSWDGIERAFLYEFLDDDEATREKEKNDKWDMFLASLDEEYMIPIQLLDDIMAKRDDNMCWRVEQS